VFSSNFANWVDYSEHDEWDNVGITLITSSCE